MRDKLFIFHTNRPDLTLKAFNSVKDYFDVTIIDNSSDRELLSEALPVIAPPIPFNFRQSQEYIFRSALDNNWTHYYWMHNDGEVSEEAIQRLVSKVNNLQDSNIKWGVVFTFYDIFCAFNVEALNAIGGWSDYFEQYYLDVHTYRLMKLKGYPAFEAGGEGVKHNNEGSATIRSDSDRAFRSNVLTQMYRQVYIYGWGGDNGSETYTTFFNRGK